MVTDLTTGRSLSAIWRFSVPLLLSTALQQIYNIADSVIVGQFTGSGGLVAIGVAYPTTLFNIAFATGASMGCSVIISLPSSTGFTSYKGERCQPSRLRMKP